VYKKRAEPPQVANKLSTLWHCKNQDLLHAPPKTQESMKTAKNPYKSFKIKSFRE